jgi:hypothetical protein
LLGIPTPINSLYLRSSPSAFICVHLWLSDLSDRGITATAKLNGGLMFADFMPAELERQADEKPLGA